MVEKITGNDAAYIKPKLIPDAELLPRDNSGGLDYEPRNGAWGSGGDPVGPKASLSADGKGASQTNEMAERSRGEKGTRT